MPDHQQWTDLTETEGKPGPRADVLLYQSTVQLPQPIGDATDGDDGDRVGR